MFSGAVEGAKAEDAASLIEKAADSGHAPAQVAFARLLMSGQAGVKTDPERAAFLIQQAAESGHAAAQAAYGQHLEKQIDPKARDVNYSEPLNWYRKAADQGDLGAICRLGMMQAAGTGMAPDAEAAWKLISRAARAGHALALNEAGICLQHGRGVEKDEIAAMGYFHAAADLGNTAAWFNLGQNYRTGSGAPQSLENAGQAFAAGARLGSGACQFALGELFEAAGPKANPVYAWVNYKRAAARGVAAAEARHKAIYETLTAAQKEEAESLLTGKDNKGK